jgi:pullulanase-type alpha-1,6-glucosidase
MYRRIWSYLLLVALISAGLSPSRAIAIPALQDELVVIPGSLQSKVGCEGDWQPNCTKTQLKFDEKNGVYRNTFQIPAGSYEYKVALGGSWAVNYGAKAKKDGPNIALKVPADMAVTFIYDPKTNYVTDTVNTPLAVVVGTFQTTLGCATNNDPTCLKTWLRDSAGDGVSGFTTTALPKGDYEATLALNDGKETVGAAQKFTVAADKNEVYFEYNSIKKVFTVYPDGAPRGDLSVAQAVWATENVILWKLKDNSDANTYSLHYSPEGGMTLTPQGVVGGQKIDLTLLSLGLKLNEIRAPHLKGYDSLRISSKDMEKVPDILRGQVVLSARNPAGKLLDATSVQLWGALDALYYYEGDLGVTYNGAIPTLRVWAPTAKKVTLLVYADAAATQETAIAMQYDAAKGVWSAQGDASWTGKYYLYEVEVYVRSTGKVEKNRVTDPYAISLSMNSTRSQIVDLNDPKLMPEGWKTLQKPGYTAPEDIVLYELHVRDFSISDTTVPEAARGTFKAFTVAESNGMKHLKGLASAGLTHIHLLPVFDIATIEEDKSKRQSPDMEALKKLPPDSDQQQAMVAKTNDQDGFNWGYDPYHYTVPEGSYSTNPNSTARILEFREMVMALNKSGLRVVMDVVYNHTNAAGQSPKSVLDRIVPGYYHRYNLDGVLESSTCCANTASERRMMEKLMVDSLRVWTTAYKVDGYRFDLMGHHMVYNMEAVQAMLKSVTMEKDGVNGAAVYLYGEGWNFGEVADNQRGVNATQINLAGTGIGTFNDRLRDGVRGGSPFTDPRDQGWLTGLFTASSDYQTKAVPAADQKAKLLVSADWIRIGLAGNLAGYKLINGQGKEVRGSDLSYNGAQAGYTLDPAEHIIYISAHDNQTIFDAINQKSPASAKLADRVRMNTLGNAVVMFSQGVPFFHAGDEMLRSKSMDRDSYNSGDWFNILDYSYTENGWGRGLPIADKNKDNWATMKPLLADPSLKPSKAEIEGSVAVFRDLLAIRKSSALFRLRTAQEIENRLGFFNVGAEQIPGVIGMVIRDDGDALLDKNYVQVIVIFNATDADQKVTEKRFNGLTLKLHPVQVNGVDPVVKNAKFDSATGTFTIPGRTAAVFVLPR